MITKRAQVACEIEANEGVAETLVAADVFLAFNPKFEPSIGMHKRNPVQGSLSPHASLPGERSAKMSFDVELVGDATAGQAIHYADALKACGVEETLVGGTSSTYNPASDSIPSVTLALYMDGKRYKLWGARGTARLVMEVGKPGIISFDFTGADFSETDASLLSGTSLHATLPPVVLAASLSIDSYSATVAKVEIDFGNAVSLKKDANAASGHKAAIITDRKAKLSLDPENVLVATEDFMGNWRSGALMAFTATLGSVAGNIIAVTAPKTQYETVRMAERDGLSVYEIDSLLVQNAGDDEWQIQIT